MLFCLGCSDPVGERLAALGSSDLAEKLAAIEGLRDSVDADQRVTPALAAIVGSDSDLEARAAATVALADADHPNTALLLGALSDSSQQVRLAAAIGLVRIESDHPPAREMLIDALLRGDGPAFLAVGQLGASAAWAAPTLVKLLSHPNKRLRSVAAMTLGQIGPATDDEALAALRRAKSDPDPGVRTQADAALERILSGAH